MLFTKATPDYKHETAVACVRKLLVHGARSCVTHLNRTRDRIGHWMDALQSRMHVNKVTVALAAKIARMAWAIITRPGAIYERHDPVVA